MADHFEVICQARLGDIRDFSTRKHESSRVFEVWPLAAGGKQNMLAQRVTLSEYNL